MTDVSFDQTRNRTLHQHMSHESKFKGSVGLTNTGAGVLELETKVIRRYAGPQYRSDKSRKPRKTGFPLKMLRERPGY